MLSLFDRKCLPFINLLYNARVNYVHDILCTIKKTDHYFEQHLRNLFLVLNFREYRQYMTYTSKTVSLQAQETYFVI